MWNEGYVSEIDYTWGYYPELAPARIKLVLLAAGVEHTVPDDPTYLELGFGQGLSLAINAATTSGNFYGNDFSASQVANARKLADATGRPLTLFEDSFEQLAQRTDLPMFDIICLHGIWSWIGDESRQAIFNILANRLKPGGVVHLSYNTTPGWAPELPLRTLLAEFAKREARGALSDRIDQSLGFVDRVFGANAAYFAGIPSLKSRLDNLKRQDKAYIAHEYLNHHCVPMPFCQVADCLSEARLTFAASANIFDNLHAINTPVAAFRLLAEIQDPVMRETTRDYFVNQRFRRDLFVKDLRPLDPLEQARRIDKMRFVLLGNPARRPTKVTTVAGSAELREAVYKPVIDALARAPNCSASVSEIMGMKQTGSLSRAEVWEALLMLTGAGFVAPASISLTPEADEAAASGLNSLLLERAEASVGVDFLAAPKVGHAVRATWVEQLFIQAMRKRAKDPVGYVWSNLSAQRRRLVVNGKTLTSEKDNLTELKRLLAEFRKERLDVFRRVGVIGETDA